jgi:hypothetical protein
VSIGPAGGVGMEPAVLIGAQGTKEGAVAIVAPGGSQAGKRGRRHMTPEVKQVPNVSVT